jgi:hypothetical protein
MFREEEVSNLKTGRDFFLSFLDWIYLSIFSRMERGVSILQRWRKEKRSV